MSRNGIADEALRALRSIGLDITEYAAEALTDAGDRDTLLSYLTDDVGEARRQLTILTKTWESDDNDTYKDGRRPDARLRIDRPIRRAHA